MAMNDVPTRGFGGSSYAVVVGEANGDLDLLELIDGRSHKLQCRSAARTREAEKCMGEGLLNSVSGLVSNIWY